ncbi:MAG: NAD(P)/FAD-dependent oxidoreductase [Thiolinea sp.]
MIKSTPYWWDEAGEPQSPLQQKLPGEVDVLVIGAGLTGLTAARTLAQAGRSVLVLDAKSPGLGASSRNGGMLGGGHRLSIDEMTAQYGADTARSLLQEAHIDSTEYAKQLMAEENIRCDFRECGRFRALWQANEYEGVARGLERLQSLILLDAEMLPAARKHEEVTTDLYHGGLIFHRHGGFNPAKWTAGLLAAAQKAGAIIQGDTAVQQVEQSGAGWQIKTSRNEVKAAEVLVATNGYTPSCLGAMHERIIPVPSFIIATEPLGKERINQLFPKGRMIVETRVRHCYYRPSPDGERIIFGGRAAMFDAPESLARQQLKGLLVQVFPELKNSAISHSWRGFTGFTFNYLPHVGRMNGIWHAMGYSGNGNTMAPYLGNKVALQMLGEPAGETAFSKTEFPKRWWYKGWPWFLPAVDIGLRFQDQLGNLKRS